MILQQKNCTVGGKPAIARFLGGVLYLVWDGSVATKAGTVKDFAAIVENHAFALPLDGWKVETRKVP